MQRVHHRGGATAVHDRNEAFTILSERGCPLAGQTLPDRTAGPRPGASPDRDRGRSGLRQEHRPAGLVLRGPSRRVASAADQLVGERCLGPRRGPCPCRRPSRPVGVVAQRCTRTGVPGPAGHRDGRRPRRRHRRHRAGHRRRRAGSGGRRARCGTPACLAGSPGTAHAPCRHRCGLVAAAGARRVVRAGADRRRAGLRPARCRGAAGSPRRRAAPPPRRARPRWRRPAR